MKYALTGLQGVFQHTKFPYRTNSKQFGFSLLEALTSLAVLSIIMSALMDTYSIGLKGSDVAGKKNEATQLAQNILAEITALELRRNIRRSGRLKQYTWQINTVLIEENDKNTAKDGWGLYRVNITIRDGSVVLAKLETLKIGKARV